LSSEATGPWRFQEYLIESVASASSVTPDKGKSHGPKKGQDHD
jgi:hypothetical protein